MYFSRRTGITRYCAESSVDMELASFSSSTNMKGALIGIGVVFFRCGPAFYKLPHKAECTHIPIAWKSRRGPTVPSYAGSRSKTESPSSW